MPIGIISQEDFNKELHNSNHKNVITNIPARSDQVIIIDEIPKGRNGKPEVPAEIRSLIAQEALLGVSNKYLAREFNVSESSVSAYKNGATSTTTYDTGNKDLKKRNNIFRDRIVKKASRIALKTLSVIDEGEVAKLGPRDQMALAKDASAIVKNMTPEVDDNQSNVNYIFFAPKQKEEEDFDVQVLPEAIEAEVIHRN